MTMKPYTRPAFRGLQRQGPFFLLALAPPAAYFVLGAKPVQPLYAALAGILSLAAIAVWILWREWTTPVFQSERQLAQYIPDVPLLGSLPDFSRIANRIDPAKKD
jgi:hypothetical protein